MCADEWDTLVQQGCRGSKEVQVLLRLRPANAAYSSLQKGWAKASARVIAVPNCKSIDSLVVLRCRAWGVPARLLPNRHLLLPSRLNLRANAQHVTCMLKWSDAAAWLYCK